MLTGNTGGANNKKYIEIDGKRSRSKYFEEGEFRVANLEAAHEMAKAVMAFKPYTPFYTSPNFGRTIMLFLRNPAYSNAQMVDRVKNNPHLLQGVSASAKTPIWQITLEDVYNHR
ncbi:hypothetical protein RZS08_45670, partial [Arthrospira platensis SPKY1]|nr:hypothetical protein [Arthrospira platensis SPKY1]